MASFLPDYWIALVSVILEQNLVDLAGSTFEVFSYYLNQNWASPSRS